MPTKLRRIHFSMASISARICGNRKHRTYQKSIIQPIRPISMISIKIAYAIRINLMRSTATRPFRSTVSMDSHIVGSSPMTNRRWASANATMISNSRINSNSSNRARFMYEWVIRIAMCSIRLRDYGRGTNCVSIDQKFYRRFESIKNDNVNNKNQVWVQTNICCAFTTALYTLNVYN